MPLRCFTPADTELYQRGFPHLVVLVDDPKKPVPVTKLYNDYFGAYATHWPRSTARGFVRAGAVGADFELGSGEATAAAARTDEIDRAEAQALIEAMLARKIRASQYDHEHWLFCLEALLGTDLVLDLLATALAALPPARFGIEPTKKALAAGTGLWPIDDAVPSVLAYASGYLLLRASPAVAKAARATLEALWKRTVDAKAIIDEESLRGGLDLALHGIDGARRILTTSHWQYLMWWGFVDDTDMILERLADSDMADFHPDPRLAWLGGEAVLVVFCSKKIVRSCGKQRLAFFEQIGKFDHPAVAEAMAEWQDDKRAGAYATQWLVDHRGVSPAAKKPAAKKPAPKKPAAKQKKR